MSRWSLIAPILLMASAAVAMRGGWSPAGGASPALTHRLVVPQVARDNAVAAAEFEACHAAAPVVALLVDPALSSSVRPGLRQFELDLCADGFTVFERRADFANPAEVRGYLTDLRARTGNNLRGAILIGNIPHAYQWVTLISANPSIPSTSEEVISFQYYADLDGVFSTSPSYQSPGSHPYSFDQHTGNVDWEIWIGVLPLYKGNTSATIDALNRFLAKNHSYRTGGYTLPRAFLQVDEHLKATTIAESDQILAALRTGLYAWTPFSTSPGARIYFDSPPAGLSPAMGYADLAAGVADFTDLDAHGYWGASGQLTIQKVETTPVKTVFLWSNGCATGDLDHSDNFLSSVLYSPTSTVLVAKGTTNDSGGMGNNTNGFFGHNVATSMSVNKSFGQAIVDHVNVPLLPGWANIREFLFASAVVLGDPTLRLR
ncbi:MAG: hypothetical protein HY875_14825 [Chloroflexi bacterium]|nr:hypothetical protein [Chloroflexota bacterium]